MPSSSRREVLLPRSRASFPVLVFLSLFLITGCGSGDSPPGENAVRVDGIDTGAVEVRLPLQGDSAPEVPTGVVAQNGNPAGLERLQDGVVFLAFIYTRCPNARMCPLITRRMRQLQQKVRSEGSPAASFVLATLDPTYDTPAVLRSYADRHDLDRTDFELWTGPPGAVKQLHERYNITAVRPENAEDDPLVHNLRLYLIDRRGTIRAIWTGNDWTVDEVHRRLRSL